MATQGVFLQQSEPPVLCRFFTLRSAEHLKVTESKKIAEERCNLDTCSNLHVTAGDGLSVLTPGLRIMKTRVRASLSIFFLRHFFFRYPRGCRRKRGFIVGDCLRIGTIGDGSIGRVVASTEDRAEQEQHSNR